MVWEKQEVTSLSLPTKKVEARGGQLDTRLKQLVGKLLVFWLYLVQVGRMVWAQRVRSCFHPTEVLRCSPVALLFLNCSKQEPGPDTGGGRGLESDSGSWLPLL